MLLLFMLGGEIEELPIAVGVDEQLLRSSSSASRRNATHIRRPAFAPVFIQISRVVAQHSPMIGELWHPLAPTLRNIFISCHYDYGYTSIYVGITEPGDCQDCWVHNPLVSQQQRCCCCIAAGAATAAIRRSSSQQKATACWSRRYCGFAAAIVVVVCYSCVCKDGKLCFLKKGLL